MLSASLLWGRAQCWSARRSHGRPIRARSCAHLLGCAAVPDIKFCGLTRAVDAAHAVALGVHYLGVVLAPSPRQLGVQAARELFRTLGGGPPRVGVFVTPSLDDLAQAVEALQLSAVQIHGAFPLEVGALRARLGVAVWGVADVTGAHIDSAVTDLANDLDVLLLDTSVDGRSGGSGRAFDWAGTRARVSALRSRTRVAVGGGLRPENVAEAVGTLSPDIVDVSSGIEASPGVKDHARMLAFVTAARGTHSA